MMMTATGVTVEVMMAWRRDELVKSRAGDCRFICQINCNCQQSNAFIIDLIRDTGLGAGGAHANPRSAFQESTHCTMRATLDSKSPVSSLLRTTTTSSA